MIAIINYGVGNIASIKNMFKKIGVDARISTSIEDIHNASKILLPGIGAFDHCMQQFNASGLREAVEKKVLHNQTPILGVCVGCQMLMEKSEEGVELGLGWIPGEVKKFDRSKLPADYKIPHMGWTNVKSINGAELYEQINEPRFYFVHSYHIETDPQFTTATAVYGYPFVASVGRGHIQGVQFHPEKSHRYGMQLYKNFDSRF